MDVDVGVPSSSLSLLGCLDPRFKMSDMRRAIDPSVSADARRGSRPVPLPSGAMPALQRDTEAQPGPDQFWRAVLKDLNLWDSAKKRFEVCRAFRTRCAQPRSCPASCTPALDRRGRSCAREQSNGAATVFCLFPDLQVLSSLKLTAAPVTVRGSTITIARCYV